MEQLIKFLPSYVGSKAYWVKHLQHLRGLPFVELFCGSAVLSANLASKAYLNDIDPFIYKILSEYQEQIVPLHFTQEDYFRVRSQPDWYKYAFCLQKMSFSGVFRYGKNGYNVPVKKNIPYINVMIDYAISWQRYLELSPVVSCKDYKDVVIRHPEECVLILDPPYQGAQASYNKKFDYEAYWKFVEESKKKYKHIVLFDSECNMPYKGYVTRKSRVNGKHKGGVEAMLEIEGDI